MSLVSNIFDSGIIAIHSSTPKIEEGLYHIREEEIDYQGLANRIYNFIKSWLREILYFVTACIVTVQEKVIGMPSEYVIPSADNNHWKKGNKGLYVAIHGINGHPNIWHNQLSALRKEQPDFEIRLPYVPKRGNCSLDEAVRPIEAMIRDYIRHHPNQPVCLLGVSNGARIAAELEVRLRDTKAPIKVSCVAGPIFGTKQMNLLNQLGLAKWIYPAAFIDEMLYQNNTAIQLLKRMREPLARGVRRSYDFFVSPNDFQIKPYTVAFPILNQKNVTYCLVPGENHNSIVSRISAIQLQHCVEWMHSI